MGGLLENIRIYDNVSRDNGYFGVSVGVNGGTATHPMSGIAIINNTVVGNGTTGWGAVTVYNPDASNVIVRNNLVSDNASFQIAVSADVPAGPSRSTTTWCIPSLGVEPDEVRGTSYVEADPLFVNGAAHDFHLQPGPPAIDHGNASLAPAADADGVLRPQGAGIDIGAYEVPAPLRLHVLTPCRIVDTRWLPEGPVGGPAIQPSGKRRQGFRPDGRPVLRSSGCPGDLNNVTVTQPQAAGTVLVYPAGLDLPVTSTVSFAAGRTRANNAILGISVAGEVQVHNTSAGTVHFIVDVNGYFR